VCPRAAISSSKRTQRGLGRDLVTERDEAEALAAARRAVVDDLNESVYARSSNKSRDVTRHVDPQGRASGVRRSRLGPPAACARGARGARRTAQKLVGGRPPHLGVDRAVRGEGLLQARVVDGPREAADVQTRSRDLLAHFAANR